MKDCQPTLELRKHLYYRLLRTMFFKKIAPYFLVFLLLCIDVSCTAFFEEQILATLAIFYCFLLFRSSSFLLMGFTALALGVESFLYHGRFGPLFLILIPITLLSSYLSSNFNLAKIGPILAITCYLSLYWLFMEPLLLGISGAGLYTTAKIGVNILVMTVFS